MGSKGTDVEIAQEALNKHGANLVIDGDFWVATDAAVRKFQKDNSLVVDGEIGPNTWTKLGVVASTPPPTGARPSNGRNVPTGPDGVVTFGVDISRYQPNPNYKAMADGGKIKFVWTKATEGLTVNDSMFAKDLKGCRDNGIIVGAYHFFRPDLDPIQQMKHFFSIYKPQKGDLVPMFDNEIHGSHGNAYDIQRACDAMDYIAQVIGRLPIHYTYVGFMNDQGNPQQYYKYPVDIAHYGVGKPSLPPPYNRWDFWQYIAKGSVDGISGDVDHNYFNGSLTDLQTKWVL